MSSSHLFHKGYPVLPLAIAVALLLCSAGCGKKTVASSADIGAVTPVPESFNFDASSADASDSGEDTMSQSSSEFPDEDYNTIDEASDTELKQLKQQLEQVMDACQPVFLSADKGDASNPDLSSTDIASFLSAISSLGYSAIDYFQTMDMQGASSLQTFCENIYLGEDTAGTYYMVFRNGQVSQYTLMRESGVWHLITMSAEWDENGNPNIYSSGRFAVSDVSYTQKGRLVYNRNFSDFDDNQKDNSDSWVFVKVTPTDSTLKALCETYIEPIGYFENNLFTTTWDSSNFTPIDFNCLYAYLFKLYTGTAVLNSYNVYSYYSPVGSTGMYLIPTASFEKVVKTYFNIDSSTLKSISDYSAADGGYFFLGYRSDYYNVLPRTPEPEVTDYWYNSDGTLTIRVEAVNEWYGTDKAFTHDVTVSVDKGGSFRYISNKVYTDENSILPTGKLSAMLDARVDAYLNP